MSQRFAERRRAESRRRWKRIALAAAGVLGVVGLIYVVWFSSLLTVEKIEVKGVESFSDRRVVERAQSELDRPLARVDTNQVRARIATLRRVERVEVDRRWPHTLRITILEREAVAWIGGPGSYRGVDRFGKEFREYPTKPNLIEIRVLTVDSRKRQQGLEVLGQVIIDLREHYPSLLKSIVYMSAETRDSVELHLTKGRTVVWGSEAEAAQKAKVLRALLSKVKSKKYNVSAPEQPTSGG